jgi:tetratricopeptide (TPR) repeat protein
MMSFSPSTYQSKLFRDFKAIEATAYRQIIHFYEKQESYILQLDFEEHFELQTAYVNALFEVGAYHRHLLLVDVVIEMAITNNIEFYKGEDIFLKMLFRKAASLYNMLEYDKAEYILREIIKINPWDKDAAIFLKKCLRRQQPKFLQASRAISIVLFLVAAVVIAAEVLVVRPFYPFYADAVEQSRFGLFGLGLTILIGADLLHRAHVENRINHFVNMTRRQKDGI